MKNEKTASAAEKPAKKQHKKSTNLLIRKLRMKFIAMMMGVVVLFLLAIFGVQYLTSMRSMEADSQVALNNALSSAAFPWNNPENEPAGFPEDQSGQSPDFSKDPGGPNPSDGTQGSGRGNSPEGYGFHKDGDGGRRIADFMDRQDRVATLIAFYDTDGSITTRRNDIFFIETEDDVKEIVTAAIAEKKNSGSLDSHDLRYMKKTLNNGIIAIAFADNSSEKSVLRSTLFRSLWISLGVIFIMFLLSLWFSRLATRPVERAWDDQKRFVADASHELKTPLTVIMSNTGLVTRSLGEMIENDSIGIEPDSPAARKLQRNLHRMENVREESNRMKDLISELLDVARGDVGRHPETFQEVSVSEIVEESLLTWESVYFDAGKTLTGKIEPDIFLTGDRTLLRRLTDILIDNALKYSNERSEVTVTLKKEKIHGKKQIHLSVENAGTPLTEEELSHLFDRFYRADSSREQIAGYGLGLSIAQGIAEAHRGQIRAEATEQGNCFHVTLP